MIGKRPERPKDPVKKRKEGPKLNLGGQNWAESSMEGRDLERARDNGQI